MSTQNFRIYLQSELAKRCKKNPKYSLRAFAACVKVSPSFLSHLLNGKRRITISNLRHIGSQLGLSPNELAQFQSEIAPPTHAKVQFTQLENDQFEAIADWYHYAILELLELNDFEPSIKEVSRLLSISQSVAKDAVERLQRLGILSITDDGKWINRSGNCTTSKNPNTAAALKKLQGQVLSGAQHALEHVAFEDRDQGSLTVAFDSSLMPLLKKRLREMRAELCALQSQMKTKDCVYQMSFSLYPISKKLGGEP